MKNTSKPVTPTDLNVYALAHVFADGCFGTGREFANRIESVSRPHVRRCIAGGLVEIVNREALRLTDAGVARVSRQLQARIQQLQAPARYGRTERELAELDRCTKALAAIGGAS